MPKQKSQTSQTISRIRNYSPDKTYVCAYVRISTDKQDKRDTIENQIANIQQFCAKNNYILVKIFKDVDSGAKDPFEREGLQEMFEYCKNPPITHLIVDKVDRLARDMTYQTLIKYQLNKQDIKVLYATDNGLNISEDDDPMTVISKTIMEQMLNAFAQYERYIIKKRLTDGMNRRTQNGLKACGKAPFGYMWVRDSNDSKYVQPNPEEANIVKEIFQLRIEPLTFQAIADKLNSENKLNKGKIWYPNTVMNILRNDFYIGKLNHKGKKIDGKHEPIITEEEWKDVIKAGKILVSQNGKNGKGGRGYYLREAARKNREERERIAAEKEMKKKIKKMMKDDTNTNTNTNIDMDMDIDEYEDNIDIFDNNFFENDEDLDLEDLE